MKRKNRLSILVMFFVLIVSLTACGSKQSSDSAVSATLTPAPETVVAVLPTASAVESSDSLIGTWVDITSNANVAKITKVNGKLQYKDNDGTCSTKYKKGILRITARDNSKADAYIDNTTGHMMLKFGDNIIEFKRK